MAWQSLAIYITDIFLACHISVLFCLPKRLWNKLENMRNLIFTLGTVQLLVHRVCLHCNEERQLLRKLNILFKVVCKMHSADIHFLIISIKLEMILWNLKSNKKESIDSPISSQYFTFVPVKTFWNLWFCVIGVIKKCKTSQ